MKLKKYIYIIIAFCGLFASSASSNSLDLDLGFKAETSEFDLGCRNFHVSNKGPRDSYQIYQGFAYNKMHVALAGSRESDEPAIATILTRKRIWSDNVNRHQKCAEIVSSKYKIIVDLDRYQRGVISYMPFVLISKDVCSNNPELVFITDDKIQPTGKNHKVKSSLFSKEFYEGKSNAPRSIHDLEWLYTDTFILKNRGFTIAADRKVTLPHQFYVSVGHELKIPETEADFENKNGSAGQEKYGPNAVMTGIYYAIAAIKAQCNKTPETLGIKSLMFVQRHNNTLAFKADWKQYFSGNLHIYADGSAIIPDEAYREIGGIFSDYYDFAVDAEHRYQALPKRFTINGISKQTKMALGAAFFATMVGANIMNYHEECEKDPTFC